MNKKRRKTIDSLKYFRLLPYLIFIILGILFYYISLENYSQSIKGILLNLSAASFFVLVAYFTYDMITSIIKHYEQIELREFIQDKVHNDIFYILFSLKKYLYEYNSQTNTYPLITEIINYNQKQIESALSNRKFMGFQIFKKLEREIFHFQNILENNLVIAKISSIKIISIVRIVNDLKEIELFFRNKENYIIDPEIALEFDIKKGSNFSPFEYDKFLLLKKTKFDHRFIVYDSGIFDERDTENLMKYYVLKRETSKEISFKIHELITALKTWFDYSKDDILPDSRIRKIKEFYSMNTGVRDYRQIMYSEDIIQEKLKKEE